MELEINQLATIETLLIIEQKKVEKAHEKKPSLKTALRIEHIKNIKKIVADQIHEQFPF